MLFTFSNVSPHGASKRDFLIKYLPHIVRGYVANSKIDVRGSIASAFPSLDADDAVAHVMLVLSCIDHSLKILLGVGISVKEEASVRVEDVYMKRVEAVRDLVNITLAPLVSPLGSIIPDGFVAGFVPRLSGRIASIFREKWTLDDLYLCIEERVTMVEVCVLYRLIDEAIDKTCKKYDAVPFLYQSMWKLVKGPENGREKDRVLPFDNLENTCDRQALYAFARSMLGVATVPPLSVFARKTGLIDALRKAVRHCKEPVPSVPDTTLYDEQVLTCARRCVEERRFCIDEVCAEFSDIQTNGILAKAVYDVYCDAMNALGLEVVQVPEGSFYVPAFIRCIVPADWYVVPFVSRKTLESVIQCRDLVLRFGGTETLSDAWVKKLVPFVTTQDDPRAVAREYKRIQKHMAECLEDEEEDDARSVFSKA